MSSTLPRAPPPAPPPSDLYRSLTLRSGRQDNNLALRGSIGSWAVKALTNGARAPPRGEPSSRQASNSRAPPFRCRGERRRGSMVGRGSGRRLLLLCPCGPRRTKRSPPTHRSSSGPDSVPLWSPRLRFRPLLNLNLIPPARRLLAGICSQAAYSLEVKRGGGGAPPPASPPSRQALASVRVLSLHPAFVDGWLH